MHDGGIIAVEMTTSTKLVKAIQTALAQPLTTISMKSFLADTRRLLEVAKAEKQYPTLKFHCDWILHTKMDRTFASTLLREFDEVWDKWITSKIPIPTDFTHGLPYKIGLFGFEHEFREFLGKYEITMPDPIYRAGWQGFEQVYCELIEDTELNYGNKKAPLKHIDGAIVRRFKLSEANIYPEIKKEYEEGGFLPYGIEWLFTLGGQGIFAMPMTFPSHERVKRDKEKLKEFSKGGPLDQSNVATNGNPPA